MSDELKACPFCGNTKHVHREWVNPNGDEPCELEDVYEQAGCEICAVVMRTDWSDWNDRPLEDALRADKERAEAGLDKVRAAYKEHVALSNEMEVELTERAEHAEATAEKYRKSAESWQQGAHTNFDIWQREKREHDQTKSMVERLIKVGNIISFSLVMSNQRKTAAQYREQTTVWRSLVDEWEGEQ